MTWRTASNDERTLGRGARIGAGWLLIALLLGFGIVPSAQQSVACADGCDIELGPIATLSDPIGGPTGLRNHSLTVSRDGNGRYIVPSADLSRLLVFTRQGKLERSVTGSPSQPFSRITSVMVAHDGTLRVYDVGTGILSTLDRNLSVLSGVSFPYRPSLMLRDGTYLRSQQIATAEQVGQPLHVLAPNGAVVRSFGLGTAKYRADQPTLYDRVVCAAPDGGVWSAPPGKYLLELWDPTKGTQRDQLAITSTWFRESTNVASAGARPDSVIVAMWHIDDFIWILMRDADRDWAPLSAGTAERALSPEERDRQYDWILEAVSVKSKRVVASRRFDRDLSGRGESFLLTTRRQNSPSKLVQMDLVTPRLRGTKEK